MIKSLYEILEMKGNSIMKSVVLKTMKDPYANIKIDIEAYDQTFLNAVNKNGTDYILKSVEKKMQNENNRQKICETFHLDSFEGALVTLYTGFRVLEYYLKEDGKSQYS